MPHLSDKELEELYFKNKQGDLQAREKLVSFNLPLVHALCRRYPRETVDYEDIFQEGCIGLLKALQKYDPEKGTKFSTYAVPFILVTSKLICVKTDISSKSPFLLCVFTSFLKKGIAWSKISNGSLIWKKSPGKWDYPRRKLSG